MRSKTQLTTCTRSTLIVLESQPQAERLHHAHRNHHGVGYRDIPGCIEVTQSSFRLDEMLQEELATPLFLSFFGFT